MFIAQQGSTIVGNSSWPSPGASFLVRQPRSKFRSALSRKDNAQLTMIPPFPSSHLCGSCAATVDLRVRSTVLLNRSPCPRDPRWLSTANGERRLKLLDYRLLTVLYMAPSAKSSPPPLGEAWLTIAGCLLACLPVTVLSLHSFERERAGTSARLRLTRTQLENASKNRLESASKTALKMPPKTSLIKEFRKTQSSERVPRTMVVLYRTVLYFRPLDRDGRQVGAAEPFHPRDGNPAADIRLPNGAKLEQNSGPEGELVE